MPARASCALDFDFRLAPLALGLRLVLNRALVGADVDVADEALVVHLGILNLLVAGRNDDSILRYMRGADAVHQRSGGDQQRPFALWPSLRPRPTIKGFSVKAVLEILRGRDCHNLCRVLLNLLRQALKVSL